MDPLARPHYTEAQIQAIRAVYNGTADERQMRMAHPISLISVAVTIRISALASFDGNFLSNQ